MPTTRETTPFDPTATTVPTTTRTPGGEFECPPGVEGDFPDPEDCGAFYTCVGGIPYHNFCPDGLHFNPITDSCDYPDNVDCMDRPSK